MIEIVKYKPEEIDQAIEGLDGLQKHIVPFLLKTNLDGLGKEDAEQFKRHIMLAKHALIATGDYLEEQMNGKEEK